MTVINYNDECNNDENNAIVNSTNINGAIHMHHNNTSDNITQSSTTDNNSTSSDCEEGGEEDLFDTKVEICRFRKYSLAKPEAVNLFQNARFYSNVHRKRRIEPKPKAFIMFADLVYLIYDHYGTDTLWRFCNHCATILHLLRIMSGTTEIISKTNSLRSNQLPVTA